MPVPVDTTAIEMQDAADAIAGLIETLQSVDAQIESIRKHHDYTLERVTGRRIDYAVPSRGLLAGSARDLKRFYDQLVPKD